MGLPQSVLGRSVPVAEAKGGQCRCSLRPTGVWAADDRFTSLFPSSSSVSITHFCLTLRDAIKSIRTAGGRDGWIIQMACCLPSSPAQVCKTLGSQRLCQLPGLNLRVSISLWSVLMPCTLCHIMIEVPRVSISESRQ